MTMNMKILIKINKKGAIYISYFKIYIHDQVWKILKNTRSRNKNLLYLFAVVEKLTEIDKIYLY